MKLLAPFSIDETNPESFKTYVRSLLNKPVKKERVVKVKLPFKWKITKTGKISIATPRKPKWLSATEIDQIAAESNVPANEVWLYVTLPRNKFRISTQEDEDRIKKELDDFPF